MPVLSSGELAGGGPAFYPFAVMAGSGKSGNCKRSERLKAALRENLRRRKAQAKARAEAAERHSAALDDSSGHPPRK